MDLTLTEIEIMKALDTGYPDEGEYTSFKRMIESIRDLELKLDETRIKDALASLEAKTFVKRSGPGSLKLTEGGRVALRAL
jgi:hypothetical protein